MSRPHLFTYRDVLRIVRRVAPSGDIMRPDTGQIFQTILAAEADLISDLSARGWVLFDGQEGVAFFFRTLDFVLELLGHAPTNIYELFSKRLFSALGWDTGKPGDQPSPEKPPETAEIPSDEPVAVG